jgi:WD40 repeat protein
MNDEIRQELKNRYRVELGQRLGAGGFGEVFRARTDEGVPCAIKVSLERLDASSEWVAKEVRGLDAVKTITDHPRICALFDIWQIQGHLVTRWQLGQASLAERLAECCRQGLPAIPLDELLGHMAAAAEGIDFLNRECGIYHRDIKPENLLLFHGHVKLADLGLAKFAGESTRSHTGSGTLGYIPPEGWEEHRLTASSDLYSLAATYLRLRTGRNPFGDNARDIILRQEAGQPAVDGLDNVEAGLLRRTLAREPKSRPQDGAVAWVGTLSETLGVGGDVPIRRAAGKKPVAAAAAKSAPAVAPPVEEEAPRAEPLVSPDEFKDWGELLVLRGHAGPVCHAAFSPDGARIVTASTDGTARIWDSHTGQVMSTLAGHSDALYWAEFSPDGRRVVTASADETGRVWDIENGKELWRLVGHTGLVRAATFTPDGRSVMTTSGDGTLRTWNANTGQQLSKSANKARSRKKKAGETGDAKPQYKAEPTRCVTCLSASCAASQSTFVTACADGRARKWGLGEGEFLLDFEGHEGAVLSACYDADAQRIITGSRDKTVRVWDAETATCLRTLKGHADIVRSAVFRADGLVAATASRDQTIRVWDTACGRELRNLKGHEGSVWCAAFSPDGKRILSASLDGTARLWGPATPSERPPEAPRAKQSQELGGTMVVDESAIEQVVATRKSIAVTAFSIPYIVGFISAIVGFFAAFAWFRAWNTPDTGGGLNGGLLAILSEGLLRSSFFALGACCVVVGSLSSVLFAMIVPFLGLPSRRLPRGSSERALGNSMLVDFEWEPPYDTFARCARAQGLRPRALKVIPDIALDLFMAVYTLPLLYFGVSEAVHQHFLRKPTHGLHEASIVFDADARSILASGCDRRPSIWNVESGTRVASLAGHSRRVDHAVYSGDGRKIATASRDGTARLWDARTGRQLHTLLGHGGAVFRVAYSPDNTKLATASFDKSSRLWDAETGALVQEFKGHGQQVHAVQFSPNGDRLLTTSFDGTARIWDTVSGQQLQMFSKTGKAFRAHIFQPNAVSYAVFSPDGTSVLVTWCDTSMEICDATSGEAVLSMSAVETDPSEASAYSVPAFSPDGTLIAAGIGKPIHVWNVKERQQLHTLSGHEKKVWFTAFSPDGSTLVSASADTTARLWDVKSGKLLHTLGGHTNTVWWAAFAPDGKLVATASEDKTSRVWDVASGQLVRELKD